MPRPARSRAGRRARHRAGPAARGDAGAATARRPGTSALVPVAPAGEELVDVEALGLAVGPLAQVRVQPRDLAAPRSAAMISAVSRARDRSLETTTIGASGSSCSAAGRPRHPAPAPAGVVQRDVGRPLDAPIAVPVGLAVADRGSVSVTFEPTAAGSDERCDAAPSGSAVRGQRVGERPQHLARARVDLDGGLGVGARLAAVDDHDGQSPSASPLEEADAGVHDERRAGDHERVAARRAARPRGTSRPG